jgi:hypothetical protein
MEKGMAEMQKQLASMPPEQRKQMEQMMAQSGVGMGARANTVKVCISPEQAARLDIPQNDDHCKQEITQRSASTMKFKFSLRRAAPHQRRRGGHFPAAPRHYSSKSVVNTSG